MFVSSKSGDSRSEMNLAVIQPSSFRTPANRNFNTLQPADRNRMVAVRINSRISRTFCGKKKNFF